jgi:hypothetical protein
VRAGPGFEYREESTGIDAHQVTTRTAEVARKLLRDSGMPQPEKDKNKQDRKSQSKQDSRKQQARGKSDDTSEEVSGKMSTSTARKGGKQQPN